jgi:hypothetical protein
MLRYLKSPALLLSLLLVGCSSPMEFQSKHDHDTVVKFASRRTDNKRSGTQWAKVLESSFAQANDMDLRKIEEMKALNTAEAWEHIHVVNQRIEKRQDRVEPLLPIVSEDGYRPYIRLLPVEEMLAESRQAVIHYSVPEIEENLRLAENGQRLKARKAYDRIYTLRKKYRWAGAQADELQSAALALGKTYVLFEMGYRWDFFNSQSVMRYLEFWGVSGDATWQVVHFNKMPGVQYDFRAVVELLEASVSPDQTSTNYTSYSQQIVVGKEEVKDTNGIVISSKPIYETVTATTEEVRAWKDASLSAQIAVFDFKTGKELLNQRIWESESYSASSCSVSGDARAFTGCCTGGIIFFPSDSNMMDECASDLRYRLGCLLQQVDLPN